jgi:riboflavin synthase
MFTGIVEELGEVAARTNGRLSVRCETITADTRVGGSISVNGVCLTVVERTDDALAFDLSAETLARTALDRLRTGAPVNLERPVTLATRLGGHLVQGHVDGVGHVTRMDHNDSGADVTIEAPADIARYLVEKGSICVDGVSLTVARLDRPRFTVALIPHTIEATTFGRAEADDPVNLEVDVIAKYVERFVAP